MIRASRRHRCLLPTFVLGMLLLSYVEADAQQITVQQPVVEVNSVATTVSVPDRGQIYLGGVKRAAYGRTEAGFGPFLKNVGRGYDLSHSGQSMRVFIHDLREMDDLLLNGQSPYGFSSNQTPSSDVALDSYYHSKRYAQTDAYQHLLSQSRNRVLRLRQRSAISAANSNQLAIGNEVPSNSASDIASDSVVRQRTRASLPASSKSLPQVVPGNKKADYYLSLAKSAEEKGKQSVAKLHYKMAAKYGSQLAQQKLKYWNTGSFAVNK